MFGQYLIVFRESFEAALILLIILSYLNRVGMHNLSRYVWYGVYLSVAASLGLGLTIWLIYGVLPKTLQLLFETLAAFTAVIVLSSVVYWMAFKGKYIKQEMEQRVEMAVGRGSIIGLMSLSFVVVFREGFEIVLFLTPFFLTETTTTIVGALAGMMTVLILSLGIYMFGMKINIRRFFYFTSILLVLIAGGLAGYGAHEIIEYFEEIKVNLGWLSEKAYMLNISSNNLLHHKNLIGSILAVMFGYTVSAEWARVIVHLSYLAAVLPA
ncbi:FTR1 family protein, partial [Candidatus Bathyarchaeota archaeon]|nr:FTR1 family protein [Candidatus Bathyarchaeota archaeon]